MKYVLYETIHRINNILNIFTVFIDDRTCIEISSETPSVIWLCRCYDIKEDISCFPFC